MTRSPTSHTERQAVALAQLQFESLGLYFRPLDVHDFGIDAQVELDDGDAPSGELLGVQIKGGPSWFQEYDSQEDAFVFRETAKHFSYWLDHCLPNIVVLCDLETRQAFWQRITRHTVVSTGKGRKLLVPKAQQVQADSLEKLKQIATRVVPCYRYSILSQSDTSWAGAKRYSIKVLLNGTLTKAEIADVVRQVVREHIGSSYYRDQVVEDHWRDSDAHVIFVYIYPSLEDEKSANFICRCLWLSPLLDAANAPMALSGESTGDNIVTEWSLSHQEMADFWNSRRIRKEDFLRGFNAIKGELKSVMIRLIVAFEQADATGAVDRPGGEVEALLRESAPRLDQLYKSANHLGLAPIECADVDQRLQAAIASAHNLILPFLDYLPGAKRNSFQERMAIESYKEESAALDYELKKIR